MIKLLLGLPKAPSPHDAADALAVAICHLHSQPTPARAGLTTGRDPGGAGADLEVGPRRPRTWRQYRPPAHG
jgi:hypothetical protein